MPGKARLRQPTHLPGGASRSVACTHPGTVAARNAARADRSRLGDQRAGAASVITAIRSRECVRHKRKGFGNGYVRGCAWRLVGRMGLEEDAPAVERGRA